MHSTIRSNFTLAFVGLAVIPLLLVGLGSAWQTVRVQRVQAIQRERQMAQQVAVEVDAFISGLERELLETIWVHDLSKLSPAEQELVLTQLLAFESAFSELALLDNEGRENLRLARLGVVTADDLRDRSGAPEFLEPTARRSIYFSPVWFDPITGEPHITIAMPLENLRSGEVEGVLVAVTALKSVWDLIARIEVEPGESVYIVNERGSVVAHRNPSLVLRNTQFTVPETDGVYQGLADTAVFLASEEMHFGDRVFYVVAERSVTTALALAVDTVKVTVVVFVLAFLIAVMVGFLAVQQIAHPIQQLAKAAHEIREGNLSVRVAVPAQPEEVRELAEAFNSMASQLELTLAGLEHNIKKLQQAEKSLVIYAADLERSNNELQAFAYVASHDLQEPLRKIRAFSDRLQSTYAGVLDSRGLDYLQRMQNAAERMQVLIQDLLIFSRVTTQAAPITAVNLQHVFKEVLSDLEVAIEDTQAQVTVAALPIIEADPTQMRQLFQNLLSNAIKFHQPGQPPIIVVGCEKMADNGHNSPGYQIRITDNGIGFEEKYVDRIFTIFQRLHGRHGYEGTGIGLAICRKIVERHNGQITAQSSPGEGTTFIITLPERQPENAGEEGKRPAPGGGDS